MEFKKIVSPTLKEIFIEHIQTMILSGEIRVGDPLPPERTISQQMGISRSVVNSGIIELERMGFLEVRPRIGTFVADYRRKGTLETLKAIMHYNRGRLREGEIRSILQVRDSLDRLAISCLIQDNPDYDLSILKEKAEAIGSAPTGSSAALAAFEFQHELAIASGNSLLPLIFRSFYSSILSLWERFCDLHGIQKLYAVSITLYEYIERKDIEGANAWLLLCTQDVIHGNSRIYY